MFGKGISREGDVLDLAANENIIVKSGAWYAYNGNKIGQGRENAKIFLRENPEIFAEVEKQVRQKLLQFSTESEPENPDKKDKEVVKEK